MHRFLYPCLVAILVLLAPARADDARIRAEIEVACSDIARAVLAGDQKAYLAHIDSSEKHFFTEQTHWSDELATHKPVEFSMAIGEGPATWGDAAAEFPMVMSWRFESGLKDNWGMDPKGRKVKFPTVRFVKKDGKWLYAGEKWKEIAPQGGEFIVRFLDGSESIAEDIVKAFPVAKAHVDTEFQRLVKERQTLVLFKSMDHLKATVYLNMPDSYLGGWSEPGESIKFMDSYTRTVPGWTAAYAHEYGHVATWELGPGTRKMPWWVQEGVAELCAGKFRPGYALRNDADMRKRLKAGTLAAWSAVSDYLTAEQKFKQLAYTQGDNLNSFITAKWKREGRNQWLRAMASGKTLDEATKEAFGIGFDELDAQWRKYLESEPPTPSPTPSASPSTALEKDPKAAEVAKVPEPAGVRPALEGILKDMTAAVAAADQAKYLSYVSKADPVFLKEQQNWALDLGRKVPESIEFALDEVPVKLDDNGAALGLLTTKWRMRGRRDRTMTFPARFEKTDAGWLYAGENWNVHKGENSLVMYEDESLKDVAALVAEVLPDVRTHVEDGFGMAGDEKVTKAVQQVKLYKSMRHLQHSIYLSYSDGLSGWNEPGEAIKILATPGSRKGMLQVLLSHEYGHVATFYLGPKASDMPWWILEGIAELSSAKFSPRSSGVDRMIKAWAKTGKIIEWERLADFHGEAVQHSGNVYNQGHHMVAFIEKTFARPKLNAWMRAMAQGAKIDEATQKVLGMSFAELDTKWRATLVEEPPPQQRE